ncbi:MAG: hypothetical protein R2795_24880 [Saprospiraceae bacterium]
MISDIVASTEVPPDFANLFETYGVYEIERPFSSLNTLNTNRIYQVYPEEDDMLVPLWKH